VPSPPEVRAAKRVDLHPDFAAPLPWPSRCGCGSPMRDFPVHGYYKQPELTRTAMADGLLHTGDAGYLDEDGPRNAAGKTLKREMRTRFAATRLAGA
jgi:hypothetical protein